MKFKTPIYELPSIDLYANMSEKQKDDIYRLVWKEHTKEDVKSRIEDLQIMDENNKNFNTVVETVAARYVYNGDYDCNLTYWNNIDNLIDETFIELNINE